MIMRWYNMWKNLLKIFIILLLSFLIFLVLMIIGDSQIDSFLQECIEKKPDGGNVTLIFVIPFEYAYYHFVLMLAAAVYAAFTKNLDITIRNTFYTLPVLSCLLSLPMMRASLYIIDFFKSNIFTFLNQKILDKERKFCKVLSF